MTTSKAIQAELNELERQQTTLEKAAVTANVDELSTIGGSLAGLGIKLRAVRSRLADAVNAEAAAERRKREQAEAQAVAELLERAAALQAAWLGWLADMDACDETARHLWERFASMREQYTVLSRDMAARSILVGADVLNWGALSGAALDAKNGSGNLAWRGK
jgi:predicted  nucleic acid-binding Zn-ribbon protein